MGWYVMANTTFLGLFISPCRLRYNKTVLWIKRFFVSGWCDSLRILCVYPLLFSFIIRTRYILKRWMLKFVVEIVFSRSTVLTNLRWRGTPRRARRPASARWRDGRKARGQAARRSRTKGARYGPRRRLPRTPRSGGISHTAHQWNVFYIT